VTVIDSPPFEVTESGWGEFEIHMQIFVHDCNDKPIEVSHILKLYPDGDQSQQLNPTKPVVSERYDEIVFNDPSEALRARLETIPSTPSPNGWRNHPNAKWFTVFDMEAEFGQLQQVRGGSLSSHYPCPTDLALGSSPSKPVAGLPNGDGGAAECFEATDTAGWLAGSPLCLHTTLVRAHHVHELITNMAGRRFESTSQPDAVPLRPLF